MYTAGKIFPSVIFDVLRLIACLKLSRKSPQFKLGEENPKTKKKWNKIL